MRRSIVHLSCSFELWVEDEKEGIYVAADSYRG